MNFGPFFVDSAGRRFWPLLLAVALVTLIAATYGVHNIPARYGAAMTGHASEMGVPEDLHLWRQSPSGLTFSGEGAGTEVRLAARQARRIAVVQTAMALPDGASGLRVELEIGAEGLEPGSESWQNARLQILSFDDQGNFLWYWPKDLVVVSADRPFGPVSAVLPLREGLGGVLIRVYNGADSGILRIGNLKFVPTVERSAFTFLRTSLIWIWGAVGLWAAWALARRAAAPLRAGILLGTAALVLAGTLTPQPAFRTTIKPIEMLVLTVADSLFQQQPAPPPQSPQIASTPKVTGGKLEENPGSRGEAAAPRTPAPAAPTPAPAAPTPAFVAAPPPDYPFSFKEAGHFSLFFLLGVACYAAFPRAPGFGRLLCLAGFAVTTESLQWFVVTRSSSVRDMGVDMAGLVLAAVVTAVSVRIMAAAKGRARDRALPGA